MTVMASILVALLIPCVPMPASPQSSGAKANLEGQGLEKRIENVLRESGFEIIAGRTWRESILYERTSPRIVVRKAPYKSLYGGRATIEFLLIIGDRQVLVETKRQRSGGSFDEKLAYVYLTAKANLVEREYVLVMAGNGWRDEARSWIEAQARTTPGFTVLRDNQFAAWLQRQLP